MPRSVRLLLLAIVLAASAQAQTTPVGSCEPGQAVAFLETATLRVPFSNEGALFVDYDSVPSNTDYHQYRVGEGTLVALGSLWVSGVVGGQRLASGSDYPVNEFWPGPLVRADDPPADCSAHDRIWSVSRNDVADYLRNGEATADLASWPAHLGAPVLDGDGIAGNYDLAAGDQPDLVGDVAVWWVMNDAGNSHPRDPTPPLGIEVRVQAFAFEVDVPTPVRPISLNTVPFVRVEIVNRRDEPIDSLRVTAYADFDIGNDFAGTDTLRHVTYLYDSSPTHREYGTSAPAIGLQVLSGVRGLADGAAEAGERVGLTAAAYVHKLGPCGENGPGPSPDRIINIQRGRFRCGLPVYPYGIGFSPGPGEGSAPTPFYYTGNPASGEFWTEVNNDRSGGSVQAGWRVLSATTGPGRLAPGAAETVTFAVPYARGADHLDSVRDLRGLASGLLGVFGNGFPSVRVEGPPHPPPPTVLGVTRVRPNPASGGQSARLSLPVATPIEAVVLDVLGRRVAVVANGMLPAGEIPLAIPDDLVPGTYLLRVTPFGGRPTTLLFTVVPAR